MDSGTVIILPQTVVRFSYNLAYLASSPVDLAWVPVKVIHSSLTVFGRLEYYPECRSCYIKSTSTLSLKFNIRNPSLDNHSYVLNLFPFIVLLISHKSIQGKVQNVMTITGNFTQNNKTNLILVAISDPLHRGL